MKQFVLSVLLSFSLSTCGSAQTTDNSSDTPWWVISLIGLGILVLIWLASNKPDWTFDGPPGCPTEIAKALGVLFALVLLLFGIIGAFNPRALLWLDKGLSVLNDVLSAWEIILGLILLGVFIYFLVVKTGYRLLFRQHELEKGEGCGFVFWTLFLAGYIYWILSTGRWTEFVEPFRRLFH